jgi:hypothetical protein
VNHERQYRAEELLKLYPNKETRIDVALSINRTIKCHLWSSWVFMASLILASTIFAVRNDPRGKAAAHVMKALDYANQAVILVNKESPIMQKGESNEMFNLYARSLHEAKMVDIALMNKHFPGFGDHFEQEFIKGLEMILVSQKSWNGEKALNGQVLITQWTKWFNIHLDEIRNSKS